MGGGGCMSGGSGEVGVGATSGHLAPEEVRQGRRGHNQRIVIAILDDHVINKYILNL